MATPRKHGNNHRRRANSTMKSSHWFLLSAIGISLVVHILSFLNLNVLARHFKSTPVITQTPVKINLVEKNSEKNKSSDDTDKKIVEVKQEKTKPPEQAKHKSFQDHKTEKETRVIPNLTQNRAEDAGSGTKKNRRKLIEQPVAKSKPIKPKLEIGDGGGELEFVPSNKVKKKYQKLIPTQQDLSNLMQAGYQEYLDDEIAIGDRIDINTTNYRYMGYFTNMRKAIELVWNYPSEAARRSMQGEVGVEFMIRKSGKIARVKVIKSSGYRILDEAIVEALKLAAPFSPLPEGFGKEKILVTGSFRYILSSFYAGAH